MSTEYNISTTQRSMSTELIEEGVAISVISSSSAEDNDHFEEMVVDDEESIHVKFQNIEIRNYQMTMGDNPSCTYGPPVSLDWDYDEAHILPLDDYEESRGTRRKSYQMQMNSIYRKKLLDAMNFTPDEIKKVTKEISIIKKSRERTKMMLPFWKLEDAAESAKRKTKRAIA